jgi:hypothetical protein
LRPDPGGNPSLIDLAEGGSRLSTSRSHFMLKTLYAKEAVVLVAGGIALAMAAAWAVITVRLIDVAAAGAL